MWIDQAAVPWTCTGNTHVYNVRLAAFDWATTQRSGLKWLRFSNDIAQAGFVFVQIHERCDDLLIQHLEIGGSTYGVLTKL